MDPQLTGDHVHPLISIVTLALLAAAFAGALIANGALA